MLIHIKFGVEKSAWERRKTKPFSFNNKYASGWLQNERSGSDWKRTLWEYWITEIFVY